MMKQYIGVSSSLLTLLRKGGKFYINDWTCIRKSMLSRDIVCERQGGDHHFEMSEKGLKHALEYAQGIKTDGFVNQATNLLAEISYFQSKAEEIEAANEQLERSTRK